MNALRLALSGDRENDTEPPLLPPIGRPDPRMQTVASLILLVGTPAAVIYHYVMGAYGHHGNPWNTFLLNAKFHFGDYYLVYRDAVRFHPGQSKNVVYSPLLHGLMTLLTAFPATLGFVVIIVLFLAVLALVLWFWFTSDAQPLPTRVQQVLILLALSYPVLFVLDRGNLEMLIFVLLAAFFYLYYVRHSRWAWVPLALAIAGKYYWVTFLVLLVSDRHYRQAMWTVCGAVGSSLFCTLLIAWHSGYGVLAVLKNVTHTLSGREQSLGTMLDLQHAHTLWGVVQIVNRWTDHSFDVISNLKTIYLVIALLLFADIAYNVIRRGFEPWQKVTLLVGATLVLPFESFDYTLLHLYFPLAFVLAVTQRTRTIWMVALLLMVPLIPLTYFYFAFTHWTYDVGLSTVIYPLCICAAMLVTLQAGIRQWRAAAAGAPSGARVAVAPAPAVAAPAVDTASGEAKR